MCRRWFHRHPVQTSTTYTSRKPNSSAHSSSSGFVRSRPENGPNSSENTYRRSTNESIRHQGQGAPAGSPWCLAARMRSGCGSRCSLEPVADNTNEAKALRRWMPWSTQCRGTVGSATTSGARGGGGRRATGVVCATRVARGVFDRGTAIPQGYAGTVRHTRAAVMTGARPTRVLEFTKPRFRGIVGTYRVDISLLSRMCIERRWVGDRRRRQ